MGMHWQLAMHSGSPTGGRVVSLRAGDGPLDLGAGHPCLVGLSLLCNIATIAVLDFPLTARPPAHQLQLIKSHLKPSVPQRVLTQTWAPVAPHHDIGLPALVGQVQRTCSHKFDSMVGASVSADRCGESSCVTRGHY